MTADSQDAGSWDTDSWAAGSWETDNWDTDSWGAAGDTRYNPLPGRIRVPLYPYPGPGREALRLLVQHRLRPGGLVDRARHRLAGQLGVPASDITLTSSGSAALLLALRALRKGPRDEVILSTFVCPSLLEAVRQADMVPVLCDIDETWNLDPADVARRLSRHTRVVIAASIFGTPARLDELQDICQAAGAQLIDDAAQSLGGTVSGRPTGTWGAFGVLSFGRHKPVYAGGGGALVRGLAQVPVPPVHHSPGTAATAADLLRGKLLQAMRRMSSRLPARLGLAPPLLHDAAAALERYTCSVDTTRGLSPLAAALLVEQLGLLDHYRHRVRRYAGQYLDALAGEHDIRPPPRAVLAGTLNFLPLRCPPPSRHAVAGRLARRGVETTWLYYPLHRVRRYGVDAALDTYPRADRAWRETLCVPCRGWHHPRQIARASAVLRDLGRPGAREMDHAADR